MTNHPAGSHQHDHGHGGDHMSIAGYLGVFIALLVLLVVTVAAGYYDLGQWNLPIAMAIATVKATLIVMFFMHVKYSTRWVGLYFVGSLYVLGLGALILFMDYTTRH